MKKSQKWEKGFSLIELLIVLGLIGVVLAVVFSMQLFSAKVFSKGEDMSAIQADMRLAIDFIQSEVRNASVITTASPANSSEYHRIELSNKALVYTAPSSSISVIKTGSIFAENSDVAFSVVERNGSYYLDISLTGSESRTGSEYTIANQVLLNNISSVTNGSVSMVIFYKQSSPSLLPTPYPTLVPTPSPSAAPTTIPSPTPTGTPANDLAAEFSSSYANTTTEVTVVFNYEISVVGEITTGCTPSILPDKKVVKLTLDEAASTNSIYSYSVIDLYGREKNVNIHYQNDNQLWNAVQVVDP